MINKFNEHAIIIGCVTIEIFMIVLCWFVLNFYPTGKTDFNKQCFSHHGHVEIYEDGKTECKYPFSMP